jgi:hypothetical protein
MTILYPRAFHDSPPHSHDGVFHWEYIDDVLRRIRNCHCADIDAAVEINGWFLHIETSDNIGKFSDENNGQNRRTRNYLSIGLAMHIDIVGKKIPTQWRWRGFNLEQGGCWSCPWRSAPDGRERIAAMVRQWSEWADSRTDLQRRQRLIEAAMHKAPPELWSWIADMMKERGLLLPQSRPSRSVPRLVTSIDEQGDLAAFGLL